jgi:hypothetical protein
VQMAIVDNLDQHGLQYGQPRAYQFLPVHDGKVLRNGLTVTCA